MENTVNFYCSIFLIDYIKHQVFPRLPTCDSRGRLYYTGQEYGNENQTCIDMSLIYNYNYVGVLSYIIWICQLRATVLAEFKPEVRDVELSDYLAIVFESLILIATALVAYFTPARKSKRAKIVKYTALILFILGVGFGMFIASLATCMHYNFPDVITSPPLSLLYFLLPFIFAVATIVSIALHLRWDSKGNKENANGIHRVSLVFRYMGISSCLWFFILTGLVLFTGEWFQ